MFRKIGREVQDKGLIFAEWIKDNQERFLDIVKEYAI